jgi:hypothetical protein
MSEMSPIIENLTIPNQTMTEQVVNTDKPKQPEMSPIKMNLDKPDINMSPISENLDKLEITMTEIEQNLDLIDQQMTQIDNYVPNQHPVKQTELVETGPVVYKMEK